MLAQVSYPQPTVSHWQELVDKHLWLVRRQARRTAEQIQRMDLMDDLLQAGFYGLVEAARRYKPSAGGAENAFIKFAQHRIHGAMVDEIRRLDWRPRRVSRSASRIARAMATLEQQLGRTATEQEIAKSLDCTLLEYQQELESIACGQLESLIDEPAGPCADSEWERLHHEQKQLLRQGIDSLSTNEKQLLGFYYQNGMNQCEIALVFNVTEARISQLHKQALLKLRAFLDVHSAGHDEIDLC